MKIVRFNHEGYRAPSITPLSGSNIGKVFRKYKIARAEMVAVMEKKTVPCICGRSAEIHRLPTYGVFLVKCECGRRTGADTELGALYYWNELMLVSESGR